MSGASLYSCASWQPTAILQAGSRPFDTSTLPIRVDTDQGSALLKYAGNRQGQISLALEWLGRAVASHLGLPTFELAILRLDAELAARLAALGCIGAVGGPSLLVRWDEFGSQWSGRAKDLPRLMNPDAIARTVVLDTLLRNADRCPPHDYPDLKPSYENTWLSQDNGRWVWTVFDHTHILCDGDPRPELLGQSVIEDPAVYGLFPDLRSQVQEHDSAIHHALDQCRSVGPVASEALAACPPAWGVTRSLADAIVSFLERRAAFLLDSLPGALGLTSRLRFSDDSERP